MTKEHADRIYRQLFELTTAEIKDYRADLETHDRRAIEERPGVRFLHWTWSSGTFLTFLPPADAFPREGVTQPFLFGEADREHLLDSIVSMAEYFTLPYNRVPRRTLYFDGARFQIISAQKALTIAKDYARAIRNHWHRQEALATA